MADTYNVKRRGYLLLPIVFMAASCGWEEPRHDIIEGVASEVSAHYTDFVIYVKGDPAEASYYFNRYLDDGKSLDSLKQWIEGKPLRIQYYLRYTILNYKGKSRPIDTLWVDGVAMYKP